MVYSLDEIKKIITPIAEKYRLPAVYVFGSYARGSADDNSDIDFLVDTQGTALTSLFSLGGLYNDLEDAFEKRIDMITVGTIEQTPQMAGHADFRDNVLRERKQIYAVS